MGMEFKDKIMMHCFWKVQCQQGFATAHQSAFIGSCLTINHTCLPCLPNRQVRKFVECGEFMDD